MSVSICFSAEIMLDELPAPYCDLEKISPFNNQGFYVNAKSIEKVINKYQPKVVVELGSWLGSSTRHIAQLIPEEGIVYAVDHWLGSSEHQTMKSVKRLLPNLYEQFLSNVIHKKLTHKIIPCRMTTDRAIFFIKNLGIKVDMVYVDASHDEESVYNDLKNWYPFVKDEGVLCGDDWGWGGKHVGGFPIRRAVRMI